MSASNIHYLTLSWTYLVKPFIGKWNGYGLNYKIFFIVESNEYIMKECYGNLVWSYDLSLSVIVLVFEHL